MKFTRTSIALLCLYLLAVSATAQVSVGIRGGLKFSTLSLNHYSGDTDSRITPHIALPVEIRLSKLAIIQPELIYTQKGTSIELETSTISTDGDFERTIINSDYVVDYLQIPVLLKLSPLHKKLNFNVFMGPNLGLALGGKENYRMETLSAEVAWAEVQERPIEIGGELGAVKRTELGLIVGGGLNYQLKGSKLVLDIRHQIGLDHTTHTNDGSVSNQGTTLSFGYMVQLK